MMFQKEKSQFLGKKDKSVKGNIDKDILKIVELINNKNNYYTTSSCSGRIIVYEKKRKKQDTNFLYVTHEKAGFNIKDIKNIKGNDIWLRQEGFILHVCCKTIKDAEKLLNLVMKAGLKRSGIISLKKKKKNMIEIIGTETMDTIIMDNGKFLASDEYLNILIREANKKMLRNSEKIIKLYDILKGL